MSCARLAVAAGEVTTDVDPDAVAESKGATWRAQQADALVAVVKSYLDGGRSGGRCKADHYQVVVHADAKSLTGGAGRANMPRHRSSDYSAIAAWCCRGG